MRYLLSALLLSAVTLPAPSQAQAVKRCTDAQGNSVYTDRSCASLGAVSKGVPAPPGGATAHGFAPRGCARTPGDLAMGVRSALEARDVNRLASFYHWPGSGNSRRVMDSLEAIALRPMVAVELAYPAAPAPFDPLLEFGPNAEPAPDPALAGTPSQAGARSPVAGSRSEPGPGGEPRYGAPAVEPARAVGPSEPGFVASARRPIGLDVQQMAGTADAGSRHTRFRLHRNAGCWWLSL